MFGAQGLGKKIIRRREAEIHQLGHL